MTTTLIPSVRLIKIQGIRLRWFGQEREHLSQESTESAQSTCTQTEDDDKPSGRFCGFGFVGFLGGDLLGAGCARLYVISVRLGDRHFGRVDSTDSGREGGRMG